MMTPEHAITVLYKWRRASPPYDAMGVRSPHTQEEIGQAIDTAIEWILAHMGEALEQHAATLYGPAQALDAGGDDD